MASLAAAVARGAAFEAKDTDDIAAAFAASGRSANNLTICCPPLRPLSARAHSKRTYSGGKRVAAKYVLYGRPPPQSICPLSQREKEIHGREGKEEVTVRPDACMSE